MALGKRHITLSVLLSLSWVILFAVLKIPSASFRPDLKDHISNIHSSILFWYRGMDVYTKSMQASSDAEVQPSPGYLEPFQWHPHEAIQLKEREGKEPLLIVWTNIPRPYPPGVWVALAPFAFVTDFLGKLMPLTVYSLVFFVLLCAHFSFFILWNSLRARVGPWGSTFLAFVLYSEIIGWSLCSQIDAIAMLAFLGCLWAYKEKDFWSFFTRFSLSSLLHFRVLFFLPLFFIKLKNTSLKELWPSFQKKSRGTQGVIVLSAAGLALSAYVFLRIIDSVRYESAFNNPLYYGKWLEEWQGAQWQFLIFFLALVGWLIKKRESTLLTLSLWWTLFFSSMPFVRGWYVLFLLPVLWLNEKHPWRAFAVYIVFATSFFSSFPLDPWFPRMVLSRLSVLM